MTLLLVISAFANNNWLPWEQLRWRKVEEPLPFAVPTDLAPGSRYDIGDWIEENNGQAARRSTLLLREQIRFEQYGYLHHADGSVTEIWYTADYYDLRSAWLAKSLFRQIKQNDANTLTRWSGYEIRSLPELPVEQAFFYHRLRPVLLLQNGTEVLRLEFNQYEKLPEAYSDYEITFLPDDQWTVTVANSLTK